MTINKTSLRKSKFIFPAILLLSFLSCFSLKGNNLYEGWIIIEDYEMNDIYSESGLWSEDIFLTPIEEYEIENISIYDDTIFTFNSYSSREEYILYAGSTEGSDDGTSQKMPIRNGLGIIVILGGLYVVYFRLKKKANTQS